LFTQGIVQQPNHYTLMFRPYLEDDPCEELIDRYTQPSCNQGERQCSYSES